DEGLVPGEIDIEIGIGQEGRSLSTLRQHQRGFELAEGGLPVARDDTGGKPVRRRHAGLQAAALPGQALWQGDLLNPRLPRPEAEVLDEFRGSQDGIRRALLDVDVTVAVAVHAE